MKSEAEWLGGTQTAEHLGVTSMTVWRWERDDKLGFPKPTVIHGRKYWNRQDLDKWMRRLATGKAGKAA